jgi:sugar phosphate permease
VSRYRWVVLALGMGAQGAFAAVLQGLPAIGPALRDEFELSLPVFGAMLGAVTLGATVSLVPWGLLIDRTGERWSLAVGLGVCGAALWLSTSGGSGALAGGLLAAGAFGAVANVASGSAVAGWFGPRERGLALGLRQAALPLGGAAAALALPALVAGGDPRSGLSALALACGIAAVTCAVGVRDPAARAGERGRGPLRDRRIWRVAVVSALLVVSQASVIGFVAIFLHDERGFSDVAAGAALAAVQVTGVVTRIGVGRWSDRLGLRLGLLQRIALAIAASWLVVPLLLGAAGAILVPALVLAGTLSFSWNGLAFTAAAELAGAGRGGTAIALQQTAVFATAAASAPLFGAIVSAAGWRLAFWSLAIGPFVAWGLLGSLARTEAEDASIPPT